MLNLDDGRGRLSDVEGWPEEEGGLAWMLAPNSQRKSQAGLSVLSKRKG